MIICVTGTNTDVGKTVATAALAAEWRRRGQEVVVAKPVQTGEPDGHGDAASVHRLTGIDTREMVRFPEPLAPNLAARRAGLNQVQRAEVVEWIRALDKPGRVVLVEGAGGVLVRLGEGVTLLDIAEDLQASAYVVCSLELGSLNAAELTVGAIRRRGIEVRGIIGGLLPQEPDLAVRLNVEEMPVVTGATLLGCLPASAGQLSAPDFADMAQRVFGAAEL